LQRKAKGCTLGLGKNKRGFILGTAERHNLRKKILRERDQLGADDRCEKSRAIAEKVWGLPQMEGWNTLFMYVNFRSEVETLDLIKKCLQHGKQVAVPLVNGANSTMIPLQISDPDMDLKPGYYGISEPDPRKAPPVEGGEIDAVIIPGSVFDVNGGRLGYGGGYYDRFLQNIAPRACRIGLAFEMQIVDSVPLEPHDQPLDYLVTEKRIITTTHLK
jgi:5-formyltetrahydrofolate cyclo-ligase